jgi:hypothetical protein
MGENNNNNNFCKTIQVVQAQQQEQPTSPFTYGIRKFWPRIKEITLRNKNVETLLPFLYEFLLIKCLCLTVSSKTSKVYLNDYISLPQLEANLLFQVLSLCSTPYS